MKLAPRVSSRARVVVRVRPLIPEELQSGSNSATVAAHVRDCRSVTLSREAANDREFTFDHVFAPDVVTQEQFYDVTGSPLIKDLFEGYNATIIAYGQVAFAGA